MVGAPAAEVPRAVPDAWLVVEAKGSAVTFHFRTAPDVDAARARVLAGRRRHRPGGPPRPLGRASLARAAAGRRIGQGQRPCVRLIDEHRPRVVVMLGDDPTDALAFDALREAPGGRPDSGLAIAVAGRPDVSATVAPQADLVLASPREAARFLRLLGAAVGRAGLP